MKTGVCALSLLLALLGSASVGSSDPAAIAHLTSVVGTVLLTRGATADVVTSSKQYELFAGDDIATRERSSATILLDGARLQLAALSHVVIPASSPVTRVSPTPNVLQRVGEAFYWLVGTENFQVGAEAAIAEAHGTKFVLKVDADGLSTLTVIEGQVGFANALGAVAVGAAEQSTARPGEAPVRPMRADVSGYLQWEASLDNLGLGLETRYRPSETLAHLRVLLVEAQGAVAAAPQDVAAQLRLGDLLQDTGETLAAEAAYRHAIELDGTSPAASLRLGVNLLQQGRPREGEVVLVGSTRLAPNDPLPLLGRAMAAFATASDDHVQRAKDLVEKALALDPQYSAAHVIAGFLALRQGDAEGARHALERALELDPSSYQALAYLSALQLAEGQTTLALASARRAVSLAPSSGLAHESLATAEFFAGELAASMAEADLALQASPASAGGHLVASDVYIAQGDLLRGRQEAQLAVSLDPQLAPAYSTLGMIWLARNDLPQAERAFLKALELSPRLISARTGMGVTYARQGNLAAAMAIQKASIALDSKTASVHNNLGAIYLAQGQLDEAVEEFGAAIARQPKWGLVHANLALAYIDLNRFADAVREAELAVRLGEDSARCHTTLARVYLEQNRDNRAWAELRRALQLDSGYALAHLRMAEVYTRQGRSREALRHQLEGLAAQPDAIVENREYARTEVRAGAGSLTAGLKTDGRTGDTHNPYYLNVEYRTDDLGRPRTDLRQESGVFMAGGQSDAEHTSALYAAARRNTQDRPGRSLVGNAPEDVDDSSVSLGREAQYLQRYSKDARSAWTGKLGFRDFRFTEYNPDSLKPDPNPHQRLEVDTRGPQAELRYDRRLKAGTTLTAGVAFSGASDTNTVVLGTPGTPPTWTPYRQERDRSGLTGYLEYGCPLSANTHLLVGGKVAAAQGNTPVWRPEISLRQDCGSGRTLVLLTRPIMRDDVSELSPVSDWALRDSLSPLNLASGGFTQSYEAQYEIAPSNGSLLRLSGFYRSLTSFLVDLEDPNWAPDQVSLVLGTGTLRGAEAEWEQCLGRDLTGGLWVRYTTSRNEDAGGLRIPFQPTYAGQARVDYLDVTGLSFSVGLAHVGPRFADAANTKRLRSFETLSLSTGKQLNLHTKVFVSVEDILNRRGAFWPGYPGPGRQIEVGVNHRF